MQVQTYSAYNNFVFRALISRFLLDSWLVDSNDLYYLMITYNMTTDMGVSLPKLTYFRLKMCKKKKDSVGYLWTESLTRIKAEMSRKDNRTWTEQTLRILVRKK